MAKKKKKTNSPVRSSKKDITKKTEIKYIDKNFNIIILIILIVMLLLMFVNNIYMKKLIKIMKQQNEIKEIIKKDKIIFLGDSITHRYDLQNYFDNKNIINKGIEGDTTNDVLKRLQTSVYDYNVDKVVLLIGTNDIGIEKNPINNIELIINKLQSYDKNIDIVVESIYPVNNSKNSKIKNEVVGKRTNKKIKEVNQEIQEICKKKKVTYVNVYDELTDEKGNLKLEYTEEGLHISEEGYKKITNILSKYINN